MGPEWAPEPGLGERATELESGSPEVNTVRLGPNTAPGDQRRPFDDREYSTKVFYSRFRQGVGRRDAFKANSSHKYITPFTLK